jgi:hypothetical protein
LGRHGFVNNGQEEGQVKRKNQSQKLESGGFAFHLPL